VSSIQAVRPALVVDASFAIEAINGSPGALEVLFALTSDYGMKLVPVHFWLEAANALVQVRTSETQMVLDLTKLDQAGVETADRGLAGVIDAIGLARKHKLTTYDAAYLQLALDVDGELATYDRALAQAAQAEGIVVRP
jgi:predicted nucleic acid-binding protein